MLLQLFVVLLASSLVKSSAINVNIFTDKEKKEVTLTTCDDNACEAICKIFGYKDGVCSNDQCMCLKYERAKHYTEEVRSQNNCDDLSCYMTCSASGSIGGTCIGDYCYCYTFKPLKELKPKASYSLADSCNFQACDQLCRNLGFPGGACVGDRCECDNFKPLQELKPKASYSLADSCNFQACDQLCRNLGFPGGACVGDRCECDNFKPLQEFLHLTTPMKSIQDENRGKILKIIKDNDGPKKSIPCDVQACNDFCHRSNYIGGICIGGNCSCY